MSARVLIVDDVLGECRLIADALRSADFDAQWALGGSEALHLLESQPFDVVVTDLNMPNMNGITLCRRITETTPNLPVVVITAFGSIDSAVEAMRAGAYDFVTKPFDVDAVTLVLRRAVEHRALKCEVAALRQVVDKSQGYGRLLGTSQAMRRIYNLIDCITDSDAPVLLTGESGTGKELVAREIHQRGKCPDGPFIAMNCAAIPESLLESELFGYVKGAFTDARSDRQGLLVSASGGTLLLDEIGDMPVALQPRLLRVLQERCVRPIGGNREIAFDTRIIAATNRDLDAAVEAGRLREDLFYRINVIHIALPPLRGRGGDTLLLAQSFVTEIAVRNGKSVTGFTARTAERLLAYDWPGNVRELRNSVERAVALCRTELVDLEDLPEKVRDYKSGHVLVAGDDPSELAPLEEVERRYILKVVESCKGNKSQAARVLGIGRKTLYRRLVALGVSVAEDD
jgi:DNA-binding NtrC family response regulator